MDPFWTSMFSHLKDCGRNATLFLCVFAVLLFVLVGSAVAMNNEIPDYVANALPWLGGAAAIWFCVAVRRMWTRRHERLQRSPLSDDELLKARTKLARNRNFR